LKRHISGKTEPDRPELFKKVFGRKYTKAEDYLLRNELRLLNEIIYEYLTFDCVKEHMRKNRNFFNRWLAQSYYDRKMQVFASDIDEFLQKAKDEMQTEEATLLCALRAAWSGLYFAKDSARAERELNEWLTEERRRFLHRLRKIEYAKVFFIEMRENGIPRVLPPDVNQIVPGATMVDFSDLDKSDWYVHYLALQKYHWQSSGKFQLGYVQQLAELIDLPQAKYAISDHSRVVSKESLAFTYLMNEMYKEAEEPMEAAIELAKELNVFVSPSHATVRALNYFKLGKYEKALAAYEEYKKLIDDSSMANTAHQTIAYAYLHLNRTEEAIKVVSIERPRNYVQQAGRYVYLIGFILRRHYDLATSEIKNLKRTLTKTGASASENELAIADLFQSYIKSLTMEKSAREKALDKLKVSVLKLKNSIRRTPVDHFELDWLVTQFERSAG
jgi:tetratricopeptide (TPR) repeat protein